MGGAERALKNVLRAHGNGGPPQRDGLQSNGVGFVASGHWGKLWRMDHPGN